MKHLLAITPYTGDEKLVAMTEDCIEQLQRCPLPEGWKGHILAVNNSAARAIRVFDVKNDWEVHHLQREKNFGFGVGVNQGLDYWMIGERFPVDQVLVFNNDLQFPFGDWLIQLMKEIEGNYVLSPCTDVTATFEATEFEPKDKGTIRHREVSAFCWLLPINIVKAIDVRFGFPLFCPQFTNYGSDDATAAILRKLYGETPFKIVPRSWVKHLKAQTANQLRIRAGTPELLKELRQWKSANKLK